MTHEEVRHQ